ncbi:MAG TPA: TetR/AcrR family transcriptional regulator [Solibacterales bacterium]|nr:TetR/AcrR family transcriptional regulator [Bryobacterales bacterium]
MSKRQGREEALREACVREALKVIGESGVDSLSLRDVARRLGVSHQAPYKHFASRDHIIAEVVRRAFADFAEYLESRPRGEDADQEMACMGRAYLEYAQAHPLHYTLMFETRKPNPAEHPAMMEQAQYAFALLTSGLRRLPYRNPNYLPELDALFVWSCLHGLASILKGQALESLDLPQGVIAQAAPFVLGRVGAALGRPEEPCPAQAEVTRGPSARRAKRKSGR